MSDKLIFDTITNTMLTGLRHDGQAIRASCIGLFYSLCGIQLVISVLKSMFDGNSIKSVYSALAVNVIYITVFQALMIGGMQWMPILLNGFIHLGNVGGVSGIDPSSIFSQGLSIAGAMIKAMANWGLIGGSGIATLGLMTAGGIVVIYTLITAELILQLVKCYSLISLSSLFAAAAVSEVLRPMFINYLKKSIGLGLQLMTTYFLLYLGEEVGKDWAKLTGDAVRHHSFTAIFVVGGCSIVYYIIIRSVPAFIAELSGVGGFRSHGEEAALLAMNLSSNTVGSIRQGYKAGRGVGGKAAAAYGNYRAGKDSANFMAGMAKAAAAGATNPAAGAAYAAKTAATGAAKAAGASSAISSSIKPNAVKPK